MQEYHQNGFKLLPHPLYPLPTAAQYKTDPAAVEAYLITRNQRILLEREDPYRYGYEPEIWKLADGYLEAGKREMLILGGNRATKSFYCAHKVVQTLLAGEKRMVWCFQSTDANSVEMQQPIVFQYLPPEFRNAKKGKITNVSFSQKHGFSDSKFILPNASECVFRHYSQKLDLIEGGNCDLIWCDELVPLNILETLRYRLITRRGILLISFTPKDGWTHTVQEYLHGATTVDKVPGPLLPKGNLGAAQNMVPRVQQPQRQNAIIIYFHTSDNPFEGYDTMRETLEGASREEILCRAYGVPTRAIVQRFPKFRDAVHVIPPDKIPKIGTNYQIVDPAGNKNWFMLWVRIDPMGRHYVYREWPCPGQYIPGIGDLGQWAEADGKLADGKAGPAQLGLGWGLKRYYEEMQRLEGDETLAERWMDSRFGNTPSQKADHSTTIIEEFMDLGVIFQPAPLDPINEGVTLINSLLDYEETEDPANRKEPHLYISSECLNTIFALKIWTGKDGPHGASKDPVDCLRYMAVGKLVDFDAQELTLVEGGAY
jgi:hypothetical protein